MLKKVSVTQLRMGMHLHKLDGAWLEHPFWKSRFVIDSAHDLRRLHSCGVAKCWIDIRLGLDVSADGVDIRPSPLSLAAAEPADRPMPALQPVQQPMADELRQAAAICGLGRKAVTAIFNEARMGRSIDAEGCLPLVEKIAGSVLRNPSALVSLARLKTKDDYSYMHSVAVCALMVALARQIGMDEAECRAAGLAGLLHDIGKALVPLDILNKPGKLSEHEFVVMRRHPQQGFDLLREGQGASALALDVVLHHHERMDGTGYPQRMAGEHISRLARMGAICDVYDAITSNRPYKAGWDPAQSIARMASWKGHFDDALFAAFVQSLGIYPVGSVVRLASGKLAVVVEQTPAQWVAPVVKVFYSLNSRMPVTPQRLDLSRPGCQDRIVAREANAAQRFPQIDQLWAEPEVLKRAKA